MASLNRRQVLGAAGAALALLPLPAWPEGGAKLSVSSYSLPFATLGAGSITTLALVDTGSVRGIQLSERLAGRLGLVLRDEGGRNQRYRGGGRPILAGQAEGLALGSWRGSEAVQVVPGDIEAIAEEVDTVFDAILGWSFLRRFDFCLDYAGRELRLEGGAVPAAALALPLAAGLPLPVTGGDIDGRAVSFLVDTGAPLCNLDMAWAGVRHEGVTRRAIRVAGQEGTVDLRLKDLTAIRRGLGCDAVLGHNVLGGGQLWHRQASRSLHLAGSVLR